MKSVSRRSLLRDLGALSAAAAMAGKTFPLAGQAAPAPRDYINPYPKDIVIIFMGPWLFLSNAPDQPDSILVMTCDDDAHTYKHGACTNAPPTNDLVRGQSLQVSVTRSPTVPPAPNPGKYFSLHEQSLLCIDSAICHGITARTGEKTLRKLYLPAPDEMVPAVLIPKVAAGPLFEWSTPKPAKQTLPNPAATALVFRYVQASNLTITDQNNQTLKTASVGPGAHYHFEIGLLDLLQTPQQQEDHVKHFSRKQGALLTYPHRPLDMMFDPGVGHGVQLGTTLIDYRELGLKKPVNPRYPRSPFDINVGDCGGAIITVKNGV
jgi:hypothetical protein